MALKVYNTLKGEKEEFVPLQAGKVGMYVCGITPYDYCHLGHGRCYTVFDTIRRYLLHKGLAVKYVQNFTDIDDKIIKRASEKGKDPVELSAFFSNEYFKEADALGIMRADVYPKVTEHVPEIISLVQRLVDNGFAYVAGDGVYFEVIQFKEYGKLSGQPLEKLVAGARIAPGEFKRSPADFALWKNAKSGEPFWESPWGRGRPGWHIECSAMGLKHLGETFDIHGGGQDLIFPHHEDEIAQSEGATGKPFVKYWLHNGFIIVGKDKMAKSLGNFVTLREAIEKHGGRVLRFFYLQSHYREPVDASEANLLQAAEGLQKLLDAMALLEEAQKAGSTNSRELAGMPSEEEAREEEILAIEKKFYDAMDDDFNTPLALAAIFELKDLAHKCLNEKEGEPCGSPLYTSPLLKQGALREYNLRYNKKTCSQASAENVLRSMKKLLGVLGVLDAKPGEIGVSENEIETAIARREEAKKAKDFETADEIRAGLAQKGILLEDSAGGKARWKRRV